jgi:hypothetical protein
VRSPQLLSVNKISFDFKVFFFFLIYSIYQPKQKTMKNLRKIFAYVLPVILLISCQQQELKDGTPLQRRPSSQVLTQEVGSPITLAQASSWISASVKQNPAATPWHDLSSTTIENLLKLSYADEAIDGLRFMKGIDDSGKEILMVLPVWAGNDLWYLSNEGSSARAMDMGSVYGPNGQLPVEKAKAYVSNYLNTVSPEALRSFFFGSKILLEGINNKSGVAIEGLRFFKAINDEGKETYAIVPMKGGTLITLEGSPISEDFLLKGIAGTREEQAMNAGTVIDTSKLCPSYCG